MSKGSIVSFDDVSFRYPGSETWVLQNVSVTIEKGAFTAIIGGNGAGKSTFCKAINGLIPFYYVGDFKGSVHLNGQDTLQSNVAALSKHVAYVYQDFENQLVRPTVFDEVIFSPLNYGYQDYRVRGEKALQLLEIEHLRDEYIWQLSGGQKHLVALAGALALDPEIIIIDEPVAQLDPAHALHLYEKLKMLNEKLGKTILVIEHHTEFIASYCKDVLLLDQGTVKWRKSVKEALNSVEELMEINIHPPQVTMAAYAVQTEGDKESLPITMEEAKDWFASYQSSQKLKEVSSRPVPAEEIIKLENIHYGYKLLNRKRHAVLKGIDFDVKESDRIALVGSNGAGKSTILKLISGLLRPADGAVYRKGKLQKHISPEKIAETVSYIYQNPEEMFIEDDIKKDISYYLRTRKHPQTDEIVSGIIEQFRLEELVERDGRLLSGGQQRRSSLAIGLAMQPEIVLLDEPTASLDIATRKEMIKMLHSIHSKVKATLIATHDMQLVAEWATRVIVLGEGKVLADISPGELFHNKQLLMKASLVEPQVVNLCHELGLPRVSLTVQDFISTISRKQVKHEHLSSVLS